MLAYYSAMAVAFLGAWLASPSLSILDSVVGACQLLMPLPQHKSTWTDRYILYILLWTCTELSLVVLNQHGRAYIPRLISLAAWPHVCDYLMSRSIFVRCRDWVYRQAGKLAKKTLCLWMASTVNQSARTLLQFDPMISRKEMASLCTSVGSRELLLFVKTFILSHIFGTIRTSRPMLTPVLRAMYNRGMIAEWSRDYRYDDVYPELPSTLDKFRAVVTRRELRHLLNPGFLMDVIQECQEQQPDPSWYLSLLRFCLALDKRTAHFFALWTVSSVCQKLFPTLVWPATAALMLWPIYKEETTAFQKGCRAVGCLTIAWTPWSWLVAEFGDLADGPALYWLVAKIEKKAVYVRRRVIQRTWLALDLACMSLGVAVSCRLPWPVLTTGCAVAVIALARDPARLAILGYLACFGWLSDYSTFHLAAMSVVLYLIVNLFWPVDRKPTEERLPASDELVQSYVFVPQGIVHDQKAILQLADDPDPAPRPVSAMKRVASMIRPFPKWAVVEPYPPINF